jgi:hypothetical protein
LIGLLANVGRIEGERRGKARREGGRKQAFRVGKEK